MSWREASVGALLCVAACSGAVINDIGNAVDRGATSVVDSARSVVAPRTLPPPKEGEEEPVTRARAAYEDGKVAYQTADYLGAVDKFTESFATAEEIEDAELKAQVQGALYYNLGAAHLYAYDLDKDSAHLTQSKTLLQKYVDAFPDMSAEDREQASQLMTEADDKLAAHS